MKDELFSVLLVKKMLFQVKFFGGGEVGAEFLSQL